MSDSPLVSVGLPIALGIIMLGLGLTLTVADFKAVAKSPKAVAVSLAVQVLVLPAVALALVEVFDLAPLLAVGVMLLSASPGGPTATLLSHVFRGDVALNITLTAINSLLAVVTIPLITNVAIDHFDASGELGLQFGKTVQVIVLVLLPTALGMLARRRWPAGARRVDRPVRIFSIAVLVVVALGAILSERHDIGGYVQDVGAVAALFCLISLTVGYGIARLFRLRRPQAVACAMEVGIHNTTVALTVALSVLDNTEVAVPIAVYAVVMYLIATPFGWAVSRGREVYGDRTTPSGRP
jgi:BASS family bile acid:Na+ symporter